MLPSLSVIVCLSVTTFVIEFQNHIFADSVERKPFFISSSDIPVLDLIEVTVCDMFVSSPVATTPPTLGEVTLGPLALL